MSAAAGGEVSATFPPVLAVPRSQLVQSSAEVGKKEPLLGIATDQSDQKVSSAPVTPDPTPGIIHCQTLGARGSFQSDFPC